MPPVPLARVVRSGVEESIHVGSVAVADASGRLLAYTGDPSTVAFARSAMKPLQAAVSLHAADPEARTDLAASDIAVAAGSHNGEEVHLEAVRRLLARAGADEGSLRCPPSLPLDPEAALAATERRRLFHNCSGKHAAMLLACASAGWDASGYLDAEHPLQFSVLEAVRVASGEPHAVGVDGCGVPVHALSLAEMATLYARLARPESLGAWGPTAGRITEAMRREPYLVEGRGRTATAIMQARDGVIAKGGAEGMACAASIPGGVGVAVKIADGGARAAAPALVRSLRLTGLLDEADVEALADVAAPPVLGGGRPVGHLIADFGLTKP